MSLDYWPILGYGIRVTPDMLDRQKVADVFGFECQDDEEMSRDLASILNEMALISNDYPLNWISTGQMYDEEIYYLYCPAMLPWEMLDGWRSLTQERVQEAIRTALARVAAVHLDLSSLKFEEIADVGCG